MGALYEDVENFFGDIFAWYGRIVSRYPVVFVLVPLFTCCLLGLGLFKLEYETNIENLYSPINSDAQRDRDQLHALFPDKSADDFYGRQQLNVPAYGEVIVSVKEEVDAGSGLLAGSLVNETEAPYMSNDSLDRNILSPASMRAVRDLYDILNSTMNTRGHAMKYGDVCAKRNDTCAIDGIEFLQVDHPCVDLEEARKKYRGILYGMTSSPDDDVDGSPCISAKALKLRLYLNSNSSELRLRSMRWEDAFIERLKVFQSDVIDVAFVASDSLQIELRDHVGSDTKYLGFSVVAMVVLATVTGNGRNCVNNHVTLAYMGVIAALLAILGAFGLLSLLGSRFVNLCSVMPFLVLGIGADDMFRLLTEWRNSNVRGDSTEDRLANTLRSAAVSITITSLTDLLAFCIGATSPFLSVRNFCACSGVGIFLCYVNQLTFFSGCIVLHSRRVLASRHCITCQRVRARDEMERAGSSAIRVLLCSGASSGTSRGWADDDHGGVCKTISRCFVSFYPKALLHWIGKCVVVVLFGVYLGFSVWGVTLLEEGLNLEALIPPESYYRKHASLDRELFPDSGVTVMFVVHQPIQYHKPEVRDQIRNFLRNVETSYPVVRGSVISWLDDYIAYMTNQTVPSSSDKFISSVKDNFLATYPDFQNDILFSRNRKEITSSRFYVTCQKMNSSENEGELMLIMRQLAENSSLPVKAFSPDFVFYEHYVSIMKNTLLPVGVTVIGMLFVALVFIPHPIAVTCVTMSMISVVLGMMGLMHFWGLTLSAITTIQIILGVGICVSFTVHMSHAFMTATGKNRNERVTSALEKVGVPILNGAFSSLLSTVALALGSSFIFMSFFKTMLLVFFLGVLHSVVFLPVMLSFIGPRRTSKPRVFVPISPSVRSLQDTYRTNSIVHPLIPGAGAAGDGVAKKGAAPSATAASDIDEPCEDSPATARRMSNSSPNNFGDESPRTRKVSFNLDRDDVRRDTGSDVSGGVGVEPNDRRSSHDAETQTLLNSNHSFDTIEEATEESEL